MSVTVDELKEWHPANIKAPARRYGTRWCHMMADPHLFMVRLEDDDGAQ